MLSLAAWAGDLSPVLLEFLKIARVFPHLTSFRLGLLEKPQRSLNQAD